MFPVYSPSVEKPGSRIIFLIVNQNMANQLIVIQCDHCLLCSQRPNQIFTRVLQCCIFCGSVQNIRFPNSFRRIPFHRKIPNVCIEDIALTPTMDEFERPLLCFLSCNQNVHRVVIGFREDDQMFVILSFDNKQNME